MVTKYIYILILFCIQKINGERTIYSIYHLLKGKKSSQTIQDSHLFQLIKVFQTFPSISRKYFDDAIIELENNQLIECIEGETYRLTEKGTTLLYEKMTQLPLPKHLNGWKYHSIQEVYWKRLSLLVQVSSNLINFESSYIPIQNEEKVSNWLKATLRKMNRSRESLSEGLLNELITCLSSDEEEINPLVFIIRLTGFRQIGLTPVQAADELEMDPIYYQLEFLNSIHYMIEKIHNHDMEYPILSTLLSDHQKPINLTNSSAITYKYLTLGYSLDEIAAVRNLRTSTIEDHIVEIALNDSSFQLEPFVSLADQNLIRKSMTILASKQLKKIRQDLNEKVTYFQIRLVLAKFGDQDET
jgi:uncharacterized protein YpbB